VLATHALGCNPGGEVLGYPYVTDPAGEAGIDVPPEYVGHLLSKAEANEVDDKMHELYPGDAHPVVAG